MDIYIVKPGDSLWRIARRAGTTAEELARINQLSDPSRLIPNMALLLPGGTQPGRQEILANAYAYPNIGEAVLEETLPVLSFLCPFSHRLTLSGELLPLDDGRLVEAAPAQNVAPFLTVTNLSENGGFSSDIAHAVFTDGAVQDAAVENILAALAGRRYAGVNLNIEYVYPYDRESYNRFLRRLSGLLHERGLYLVTAIAPKESAGQEGLLYSAHDYAAHGRWADWVVLMTYEWGYTYSAPQAVSPVNRIRRVLDYAVTQMPAGSILLGMSNYGYRWRLPWRQGDAASVIGNTAALNLAVSVGAELRYDETAQAPWFRYTDAEGLRREVWFEDVRSVRARLELVKEYALAGISWWTVNRLFRPALQLQAALFDMMKLL